MNKKYRALATWLSFAGALAPAVADSLSPEAISVAEELRDRALADDLAYRIVASLTTEVGPRLAGTQGDRAAVAWALTKMRELELETVRAQNVPVRRWERGEIEARIVSPYPQPMVAVALGGSVGTSAEGLEAPVVRVVDIADLESRARNQIEGKIVFFDLRMEKDRGGAGYRLGSVNRFAGPAAAAGMGAVGMVMRSAGTSGHRLAHTGATRYREDTPKIPAAALSGPDADLLAAQAATPGGASLFLRMTARDLGMATSANVIGEVRGRTDPDEIVLLAAHLDSWDLGTGAVDDGSGVALMLAAAHYISQLSEPPRRTIRVVLFANEESGAGGAKVYAQQAGDEVQRHVAAMEADASADGVWKLSSRVADTALGAVASLHGPLAEIGVEAGENNAFGGADIRGLMQMGVPVLALSHDMTDYFDLHHTVDDTLDKIDPAKLAQMAAAYTALAYLAAEIPGGFGRLEASEGPPSR